MLHQGAFSKWIGHIWIYIEQGVERWYCYNLEAEMGILLQGCRFRGDALINIH